MNHSPSSFLLGVVLYFAIIDLASALVRPTNRTLQSTESIAAHIIMSPGTLFVKSALKELPFLLMLFTESDDYCCASDTFISSVQLHIYL